jgi:hypothetical protein
MAVSHGTRIFIQGCDVELSRSSHVSEVRQLTHFSAVRERQETASTAPCAARRVLYAVRESLLPGGAKSISL